ncbi:hypothetical protein [Acinetobacter seifertii]|uniref:hypothetical protein n=1 Tax=Acinetobacter seifertii TaxID=1530123 RepID=UPI0032B4BF8F
MDNYTYRYLIVYDSENNLIYGECIKWLIGKFDNDVEFNTRPENLGEGLKLQFISKKSLLHTLNLEEQELCIEGNFLDIKLRKMIL